MGMRNAESTAKAKRYEPSVDRKLRRNQKLSSATANMFEMLDSLRHERSVDSSSTDYRDT